ncbi:hypothetical protein B7Z00_05410, partial [Candidatus Saccharibacteria bacterium 32-50-10]
ELKQKGFTIIEVVLVLAIAALIFLMVFIALPALQRNQRDQARRTVMGKVASAVTTYQSNRRSQQPTTGALLAPYADGVASGTFGSLENGSYRLVVSAWATGATVGAANQSTIQVYTGAKCDPTGAFAVVGTAKQAAVLIGLENGNAVVCQEV